MRLIVIAMLLATALGGCADDAPVSSVETTEVDDDLVATSTTGVIRGVVVDNAIIPIEGAAIIIKSLGIETTSRADGSFGFSDLDPGNYFLDVRKVGYDTVQASASVEAGVDKPPVVRIQLTPNLEDLPYTELLNFDGYLQCGVGFGLIGLSTNPCAFTGSVNVFDAAVAKPVTMTQVEMIWEGTNVFGDGLSVGILIPGTISNFANSDGPSPRILPVEGERIAEHYGETYEDFTIRVFPGTSTEVSIVLEQSFEIYVTQFYGCMADEDWAFVVDGEYPDPC